MKFVFLLGSMPRPRPHPVYQAPPPRRVERPTPELIVSHPVHVAEPTAFERFDTWMDRWFLLGIYLVAPIAGLAAFIANRLPEPPPPVILPLDLGFNENPDPKTYGAVTRQLLGLPSQPPPSIGLCLYKGLPKGNVYAVNIMTLRFAFQPTVMPTWTLLIPDLAAPIPSME